MAFKMRKSPFPKDTKRYTGGEHKGETTLLTKENVTEFIKNNAGNDPAIRKYIKNSKFSEINWNEKGEVEFN